METCRWCKKPKATLAIEKQLAEDDAGLKYCWADWSGDECDAMPTLEELAARAEKAEARVKELERQIDEAERRHPRVVAVFAPEVLRHIGEDAARASGYVASEEMPADDGMMRP